MAEHTPFQVGRRAWIGTGLLLPWFADARDDSKLGVGYVPTSMAVVRQMLDLARVGKRDVVHDLGCGDGRIVVTAAKERGASGFGVDLDPVRIDEARANARAAGVESRTRFEVGDVFETDVSAASVVMLYLLPEMNLRLRPTLWRQLKPGSRIVSHSWLMGEDMPPERTERIENESVHLWTVTAASKRQAAKPPVRG
ncbi:hypothetical protein BH09PSE5_BH09PSE5_38810 [soil metagenome]